jgi:hypothetical protein
MSSIQVCMPRLSPLLQMLNRALGETLSTKLQRVREAMAKKNAAAMAVTLLDEVAWLFNLRGTDIDLQPW